MGEAYCAKIMAFMIHETSNTKEMYKQSNALVGLMSPNPIPKLYTAEGERVFG